MTFQQPQTNKCSKKNKTKKSIPNKCQKANGSHRAEEIRVIIKIGVNFKVSSELPKLIRVKIKIIQSY